MSLHCYCNCYRSMPTQTFSPGETWPNSFRCRYYADGPGQSHSFLSARNKRDFPYLENEFHRGDYHAHHFHQIRLNSATGMPENKKNKDNMVIMTGTYYIRGRGFAEFGRLNSEGWQVAEISTNNFRTPDGGARTPYPICAIIAGKDVDLEDAARFLASMKRSSRFICEENIRNLCGVRGAVQGGGKGRGKRASRDGPY